MFAGPQTLEASAACKQSIIMHNRGKVISLSVLSTEHNNTTWITRTKNGHGFRARSIGKSVLAVLATALLRLYCL